MDERLKRLKTHSLALAVNVIWPEITLKGCILVRNPDGSVYPDVVTTHHLIDFLFTLDDGLFEETIGAACRWFIEEEANLSSPFFVTSLAQAGVFQAEGKTQDVVSAIMKQKRPGGFIEIFAAFLDGASQFSTLWAIKILQLLHAEREATYKAFKTLRAHWEDLHRTSFKGFYLELLLNSDFPDLKEEAKEICQEVLAAQDANGMWDDSVFYSPYVAGNLLTCFEKGINPTESLAACDRCLNTLFDLDQEAKAVPKAFAELSKNSVESVYLQTILRALITATRRLRIEGYRIELDVAKALLGSWPTLYKTTGNLNARLKIMDQQYGMIELEFKRQKLAARALMQKGSYERNVFVMMPFRQSIDERFEYIEKIIKRVLKRKGFTAWLASDMELDPTLWGNITSFMTGCKYGIAIFTRKDNLAGAQIEPEFNPNVSLEMGFMLSRGKRILVLKDSFLKTLPTDIVGWLYKEFDLSRVNRQLPRIISKWADEITNAEAAQNTESTDGDIGGDNQSDD